MSENRSCNDCKFACFLDFGYSNYTVEGTNFVCSKNLHPQGTFDRFYGEDKRLNFASQCAGYQAGEPVYMDVDCEDLPNLTDEQRQIYEKAEAISWPVTPPQGDAGC